MTITFKPGQHPDADQLSALIEQALPAHERDGVLAHLAVCSECRGVVALALPDVPATLPAPETRRSSIGAWFSGWMVFVPAAAAVAALAVFIFFVHRRGPALPQQARITPAPAATAPQQIESAPSAQPKSATAEPRAAIATLRPPTAPADQKKAAIAPLGSTGVSGSAGASEPAAIQPASGQNVETNSQAVQSLPAQNAVNSFAPAANDSFANQNQSSQQASAHQRTFHGGAIGGTLRLNNSDQQADANAQNRQQQQNGVQQTASQSVPAQAEAPAPVTINSAEMSTVMAGGVTSYLSHTRRPVPSGLPLLSSATQGPMVLAIDTHHAVFVSNDSGQNWKAVRAVWKGRAVMVEVAVPVKKSALQESLAGVEVISGSGQGALAAKTGGTVLTGTVTDPSGAVVPGATITVTEPQTRVARTITTDANGRYVVAGLDPGGYNVDASAPGFKSTRLSGVALTAQKESVANFNLRVGAASETVTVEASAASEELKAAGKVKAAPMEKAQPASAPLFEIVTDKGVHWTSADGLSWQRK
jgi:hypothetical protein